MLEKEKRRMKIGEIVKLKIFEDAAFDVVSDIEDEKERDVALTSIVETYGIVYGLSGEMRDKIQNDIFRKLSEI